MVQPVPRTLLCIVSGIIAGRVLGPLFVPDPTGTLATGLAVGIMAITSGLLYRSNWLRDQSTHT